MLQYMCLTTCKNGKRMISFSGVIWYLLKTWARMMYCLTSNSRSSFTRSGSQAPWHRICLYLRGHRGAITVDLWQIFYSLGDSPLLVLFSFVDPIAFEITSKDCLKFATQDFLLKPTLLSMPCFHWECSIISIQRFSTGESPIMISKYSTNKYWYKLFGASWMELCRQPAVLATFNRSHMVDTSVPTNQIPVHSHFWWLICMQVWSCAWKLAFYISCVKEWPHGKASTVHTRRLCRAWKWWKNCILSLLWPSLCSGYLYFGGFRNSLNGFAQAIWTSGMSNVKKW